MNKIEAVIFIIAVSCIVFLLAYSVCEGIAYMNIETKIIDISENEIQWDEHDFYVISPSGKKISLGVDDGEVIDLTRNSKVLVKFERIPAFLLYVGSGWYVEGVVKTPQVLEEVE